jgi:Family of unknown function (DUF6065)
MTSLIRFHRLIENARLPQRADRSACGTLPTRAFRYCEAATSAAAFGWWVFSPIEMHLLWDGTDVFWRYDGNADWLPLMPSAQYPDFAATFDASAPSELQGCAPPFLTALPEAGTVQIWTGLMVRTAPGWHVLARAPANLPLPGGFALYEGIIESDRWFGPLFTNLRFTQSHRPIRLAADFPLLLIQPVRSSDYTDEMLSSVSIAPDLSSMDEVDWANYGNSIAVPSRDPGRPFGAYAAASRKRRHQHAEAARCPVRHFA